jgi:hypothetical protein
VQGTCALGTGCRGARLLVWLILNDRVQPSFIAGVGCACQGLKLNRLACGGSAPAADMMEWFLDTYNVVFLQAWGCVPHSCLWDTHSVKT